MSFFRSLPCGFIFIRKKRKNSAVGVIAYAAHGASAVIVASSVRSSSGCQLTPSLEPSKCHDRRKEYFAPAFGASV